MDNFQANFSTDANNRVMKISNGLQSDNLGKKCEAIAEFSYVIKKYPFPVIISPLFVRLVEAFKNGPNYLRLVILKNCEACKEHLGKVNCATEIIKILSQNMETNDPCARSICLKLLGLLNPIFSNNKLVHHMIILCLDSHYDIEFNAAVEASNHYAPVSNDFSTALCPKLCSKLESLSTDLKLKLELIKLAKYLHHEADTFERTRTCLISLLNGYQSLEFVINLLNTLTFLATKSSMHAKSQIEILLTQLDMEERDEAIVAVLDNILILAKHNAHIWTEDHVEILCCYYNKMNMTRNINLIASCKIVELLSIFAESSSPASVFVPENGRNNVLSLVIECASKATLIHTNMTEVIFKINYYGIHLLSIIASAINDSEIAEHTLNSYVVNIATLWHKSIPNSYPHIFKCNVAITKLILKFPDQLPSFVTKNMETITSELRDGRYRDNDGFSILCRFMARFCVHITIETAYCLPQASEVITIIHTFNHRRTSQQLLAICALIFQLANCEGGLLLSAEDTERLLSWIEMGANEDNWLIYRVARMANRYNQHNVAYRLYDKMLPAIISGKYIYWLQGLLEISKAETILMSVASNDISQLINNIVLSQKHLLRSTNFLKCSGTSSFPNAYITIRWEFLTAIYTLLITLNQYGSKFIANNPNFVVLMESKLLFESNLKKISELISCSMDADDTTIEQLKWLRKLSSLFVQTLHAIINEYYPDVDIPFDNRNGHQDYWLKQLCDEIFLKLSKSNEQEHSSDNKIIEKIRLLTTLAMNSVKIGVPFPRFLFQKLQNSEITLVAILNSKTITTETNTNISLRQDQSHKLQVCGVLKQACKLNKLLRIVTQVRISIAIVTAPVTKSMDNVQIIHQVANEVVKLDNDYFSTHILIDLKTCNVGKYHLIMKAIPIDYNGSEWQIKDFLDCPIKVELGNISAANLKLPIIR